MHVLPDEVPVETTALVRSAEFIATIGEYPDCYHGRGLVMCGGGLTYFTNAWISISLLRHVGCRLPIQLWYLGREELDPYMEELIAPLGVECIDATAVRTIYPARILNGWEVKPYAILHSPFREVLLLDADNFAVRDPEPLFQSWEYRDTGAIFWPDLGRLPRESRAWKLFGVPFRDEPEVESGQIVVNKETCWKALCLTKYYNDYSDFYYSYVHGDKETFHLAFRGVSQPYAMTPYPVRFEYGTFFHYDFSGEVLFQHRNGAKWDLGRHNVSVPEFRLEEECVGFLEQLRKVWDGTIDPHRPRIGPKDVVDARNELASRIYRFGGRAADYRPMSFRSDGRIGVGATEAECTWDVRVAQNRLALAIGANGTASRLLVLNGHGWNSESGDVELGAIPTTRTSARQPLSLTAFSDQIAAYGENADGQGVGSGWIPYGITRGLRPGLAVLIASLRSVAALCITRAMQENEHGDVILIDPDPLAATPQGEIEKLLELFGLAGRLRYLAMGAETALPIVQELLPAGGPALLLIEGKRGAVDIVGTLDRYGPLLPDGVAILGPLENPDELRDRHGVSVGAGLTLVPITRAVSPP